MILLDVMMPGMDGFEVCKHLRASPKTSQIPIIFLTGDVLNAPKGLSLSHGVAQKHQGRFIVESTVDEGTEITLFLPLDLPKMSKKGDKSFFLEKSFF